MRKSRYFRHGNFRNRPKPRAAAAVRTATHAPAEPECLRTAASASHRASGSRPDVRDQLHAVIVYRSKHSRKPAARCSAACCENSHSLTDIAAKTFFQTAKILIVGVVVHSRFFLPLSDTLLYGIKYLLTLSERIKSPTRLLQHFHPKRLNNHG